MTIHSSILDWKIPWTEEPGGLWFMESQRVGPDLLTENNNTHMSIPYCLDYVALKMLGFHFLKITKKKDIICTLPNWLYLKIIHMAEPNSSFP